ncbi:MAG: hypothetical protein AAGG11_17885 [Pseudomonadota bacterium]
MTASTLRPLTARPEWLLRLALGSAAVVSVLILLLGWLQRSERSISADSGLGYALGLLSLCCMLLLLLYPLRKRLRLLRALGPVNIWFRRHQQLGVLATLLALFHCNFQVGSLNSQIALGSTLLIAASGLVGRFLYRRINRSLNGRRTDLKAAQRALQNERFPANRALRFLPLLKQRVHRFDAQVLEVRGSVLGSVRAAIGIHRRARREQRVLMHFFRQQVAREAERRPLLEAHNDRLCWAMERYLFVHMQRLVLVARLRAYERLFALWHRVHVPFFVLLFFSVLLHVYAVHAY